MQTLSTIETIVLVTVISASVSAMITFVVLSLIEWFTWLRGSKVHLLQHSFERNDENDRFLKLRWGVNYIRDGRDNVVPNLSEREKWFARLKNQIVYFNGHYQKKAKIRFYRTLGCQFKCFIELDDQDLFEDLENFLERNGYYNISRKKCKDIERIWFIHKDMDQYDEVTTPEGFVNNFFYPE